MPKFPNDRYTHTFRAIVASTDEKTGETTAGSATITVRSKIDEYGKEKYEIVNISRSDA